MVEILIDLEKCDGDGTCVDICPVEVFEVKDGKATATKKGEAKLKDFIASLSAEEREALRL